MRPQSVAAASTGYSYLPPTTRPMSLQRTYRGLMEVTLALADVDPCENHPLMAPAKRASALTLNYYKFKARLAEVLVEVRSCPYGRSPQRPRMASPFPHVSCPRADYV